eukprot:3295086-Pyramimonas_sp.AAC.1
MIYAVRVAGHTRYGMCASATDVLVPKVSEQSLIGRGEEYSASNVEAGEEVLQFPVLLGEEGEVLVPQAHTVAPSDEIAPHPQPVAPHQVGWAPAPPRRPQRRRAESHLRRVNGVGVSGVVGRRGDVRGHPHRPAARSAAVQNRT